MKTEEYTGCFNSITKDFVSVLDPDLEQELKNKLIKQVQASIEEEAYIEMKSQYLYKNPTLTEEDFKNELRAMGFKL